MTPPQPPPPSDGVALRDYVDGMFKMNSRLWQAKWDALEMAVTKAERALEIRLESMNEFRRQIEDSEKRYVQRVELDGLQARMGLHFENIEKRIDIIEKGMAFDAGRIAALGAMFVGGAALVGIAERLWG